MRFEEIMSVAKNPQNAIFKVATVSNDGINNVKYAVFSNNGSELLSVWGCDIAGVPPKWVMEYVVVNGIIEQFSHEQNTLLFLEIDKRYKSIEKKSLLLQNRQQIRN